MFGEIAETIVDTIDMQTIVENTMLKKWREMAGDQTLPMETRDYSAKLARQLSGVIVSRTLPVAPHKKFLGIF